MSDHYEAAATAVEVEQVVAERHKKDHIIRNKWKQNSIN